METTELISTNSLSETIVLSNLIHFHLEQGHSFSLWRLPHADEKHLLVNTAGLVLLDEVTLEDSVTGFVMAPYDSLKKKVFLKGDKIYSFKDGKIITDENNTIPAEVLTHINSFSRTKKLTFYTSNEAEISETDQTGFKSLVVKSVEAILAGQFEKVVPSREKAFPLPENFDTLETFENLCSRYPNALVSLVSTPETGTWMGATPELLVSVDNKMHFRTVALAGTQNLQPQTDLKSVAWTQKDIEEQALVSRYIINCFKKIRLREFEEHGPKTAIAGNIIHLKTDFEVDMVSTNFPQLGTVMLKLLHPTSAVCGMPLDEASKFLNVNENYDREYYCGFLGPVNFRNESHVYVNLRCMNIQKTRALLYAGAGVTVDSDPQQEWEETELKMNTLLQVINTNA